MQFTKLTVTMILYCVCGIEGSASSNRNTKFMRNLNMSDVAPDLLRAKNIFGENGPETSRAFGNLFSIGKVLNFFPVGGARECRPSGHNVAKAGICLNPYDCRQRDGRSAGDCAHGLGVCCVFEVTCGATVENNLTYFMSPGFPELWDGDQDCSITIEKTHAGIMQLRIDFIHFIIGQPNRMTGECDEDAMILGDSSNNFTLCGQNHGQHIYYTMSSASEVREAGDLPSTRATKLLMRMRATEMPRVWLMRLAQVPLANSAPHDCLQYHTTNNGTIRTFNYASNGRHLAPQEYMACIRRNAGFCAVRYTPCDERSFRVQGTNGGGTGSGPGALGGAGTGFYGPDDSFLPVSSTVSPTNSSTPLAMDQEVAATQNETMQMMPLDPDMPEDELEGSGDDPQISSSAVTPSSGLWSYIRPWFWQRNGRTFSRWSPYTQHYSKKDDYKFQYNGYGKFGAGFNGYGRLRCHDRITISCENEYFVSSDQYGASPGVCDPHHCGSSFCPNVPPSQCHVETSITPFAVSVHFGPPTFKQNPEDNIGACLRYIQLPCTS